jgi:hypothetical protein
VGVTARSALATRLACCRQSQQQSQHSASLTALLGPPGVPAGGTPLPRGARLLQAALHGGAAPPRPQPAARIHLAGRIRAEQAGTGAGWGGGGFRRCASARGPVLLCSEAGLAAAEVSQEAYPADMLARPARDPSTSSSLPLLQRTRPSACWPPPRRCCLRRSCSGGRGALCARRRCTRGRC